MTPGFPKFEASSLGDRGSQKPSSLPWPGAKGIHFHSQAAGILTSKRSRRHQTQGWGNVLPKDTLDTRLRWERLKILDQILQWKEGAYTLRFFNQTLSPHPIPPILHSNTQKGADT